MVYPSVNFRDLKCKILPAPSVASDSLKFESGIYDFLIIIDSEFKSINTKKYYNVACNLRYLILGVKNQSLSETGLIDF